MIRREQDYIEKINLSGFDDNMSHIMHKRNFFEVIREFREKAQDRSIENYERTIKDWYNQQCNIENAISQPLTNTLIALSNKHKERKINEE